MTEKHESDNVQLKDEPWTILYTKHVKGRWGICDWAKRLIEISRRAKGKIELDTLIHEMIHATNPWMTETYVTETATEIAEVLWKLGYRKVKK